MWIIIPGQRLDERETLTHHALMQPETPAERSRDGWEKLLLLKSAALYNYLTSREYVRSSDIL